MKLVGLLSRPRFGPLDSQWCMQKSSTMHGFPIYQLGGAYWEQSMQKLMLDAVADGFDFALTFDYDSIFTPTNVNTLLQYMQDTPACDAVAALQPMRGRDDTALFTPIDDAKEPQTYKGNEPIIAKTAHFGLTVFRLARLKTLPLPWFKSTPSPEGTWEKKDGAEDADIYFWRKWWSFGRTLHVLPWVCIGQVEMKYLMMEKGSGKTVSVYRDQWVEQNFGRKGVSS